MKTAGLLAVIVLSSAGSSYVAVRSLAPSTPSGDDEAASGLELELRRISDRMASLEAELKAAEAERALADPLASPVPTRVAVGDIERAVEAWMREHVGSSLPPGAMLVDETTGTATSAGAKRPTQEIVQAILAGRSIWDNEELWERLRDEDRIEEVVAEFERLAEADPHNPDAQVALGGAYLQQLFGAGNTPKAGDLAVKADAAFDAALALDPDHWEARFSKAVSLSNWPAFLGKTGEAIQQFSILIEQQEAGPVMDHHAQTYLFLGNLHRQTGDLEKARTIWQRGLALHPDSETLTRQLAVNSGN